ncbi:fasciclin domain-containing protein [Tomitella gaofuii]|uniref:fasciclin domain-containing protein n=1 Tax=Tomitella gaofuii TaxID=2760083 RepID=UPI0015F844DC|nr:fasciclin domain-containing protein [Tomitella gaofuii]
MRTTTRTRLGGLVALAAAATLGLTACSSDGGDSGSAMSGTTAASQTQESGMSSGMAEPASDLVGPGCAAYAEQNPSGPGSVSGMAQDPVATAASNNPMLTTLTKAVSGQVNPDVNLVDTLNSGQFTVFAPTDEAFGKIDPETMSMLQTNADALTQILTYHVVPGQLSPDEIAGTHKTVEGAEVTVTGSGDDLKVDGASVVCGGVQTANATVYLIDSVLMPPQS